MANKPTATKVSIWQDNLRNLYEQGRDIPTLAHWTGLSEYHLKNLLRRAGTKFRRGGAGQIPYTGTLGD